MIRNDVLMISNDTPHKWRLQPSDKQYNNPAHSHISLPINTNLHTVCNFSKTWTCKLFETLEGMSILSMYVLLLLSSLQSLGAKTVRVDKSMTGAA